MLNDSTNVLGGQGDLSNVLGTEHADEYHHQVGDEQSTNKGIDDLLLGGEQAITGGQAMDGQARQQHGSGGVAGDTQRQGGDQGAAGNSVVGRLTAGHTLPGTVTEVLLLAEHPPGVVGDIRGHITAGAGDNTHYDADDGRAEIDHRIAD